MKRLGLLVFFVGLSSGFAQESDVIGYDEILAQMQEVAVPDPGFQTSLSFGANEFNNTAYQLSGQMWSVSPTFSKPQLWMIGLDVPFLSGQAGERVSQEIGNIRFRSRFNAWDIDENFSLWVPFSVRMAQRGETFALASQHDTYRAGLDLDYRKGALSNSMGLGYQLRTSENDPRLDVGDIVDFHNTIRVGVTDSVSARLNLEFYRIFPTTFRRAGLVRTLDWAAVSPGLSIDLFRGVFVTSELTVPILQSGTPFETDLAFGEIYYPQASTVTWNWGMGASF